jgi:type IV pilus assembly protein PilF
MVDRDLFQKVARGSVLLALLTSVCAAMLTGCGSTNQTVAGQTESFTESDEPESRKRATNRLRLAVLYFSDGKTTIALDEVKQAIAADPNWFEAYSMRGLIYMRLGDFPLADASFQKALSLNPASAEVKHNYGVLLCKQGRSADAKKMFTQALDTAGYGRRSNTWTELAICQLSSGQTGEAETSFLRAYEVDPANPVAGYKLASLFFQKGDLTRAQFYIRRLNNSEQASAESLWLGIKVERRLRNFEAQAQLSTQLKKRFPQSREALAMDRGNFDE